MTIRMADLPRSDQLLMKKARERTVHEMTQKLAAELADRPWLEITKATRARYEGVARAMLKIAERSLAATRANAARTPEQRSEASRKANAKRKTARLRVGG